MVTERRIGQFTVSPLGFGAMPLSTGPGQGRKVANPIGTLHAALDEGITMIDTADIYAPSWDQMGHNERIVAAALRAYDGDTDQIVICTKAGITRAEGERWGRNGSPEYLRERAERALESLEMDKLDLLYLHRPDRSLPYAKSIEGLAQLKDDGLVTEVGISNASVEEIEIAVDVLGDGGLAAVQNEFSPWFHHTSRKELELCAEMGVAFVPYSPIGGMRRAGQPVDARFHSIRSAADELGISPQRVILAWELSLSNNVIPIPGATRVATITDSAHAMTDVIPDELLEAISQEVL
jgi:aryl-alcohol dehydrogenase-like predicted oxidoreductase